MTTAKTRQEAAVEALREAIVDGVYAPGQRLRQQELAKQYGCSVIPIREALHQLAAEGFVVLDPQRGARVATSTAGCWRRSSRCGSRWNGSRCTAPPSG